MKMLVISAAAFATLLSYAVETKKVAAASTPTTSNAAPVAPAPGTTTTAVASSSEDEVKFVGSVELRPGYKSAGGGGYGSEDTVELGYQWAKDRYLGYTQYFDTNDGYANVDKNTGNAPGQNLITDQGFINLKINNIWTSENKVWSLSYNPRLYLPTYAEDRDSRMVAFTRQYLNLAAKVNDTLTLTFSEIPFLYGYEVPGTAGNGANRFFENRFYVVADLQLTDKLAFSFPILFEQHQYRNFQAGAKNNDMWTFKLWIWPELTYQILPKVSIGAAYYSGNMFGRSGGKADAPNVSVFDFGTAFTQGVTQAILKASL